MDWRIVLFAVIAKPFVLVVMAFFILAPARYAVVRWMPECLLKRILLFRYTEGRWYRGKWYGAANERIVRDV